MQPKLRSSLSAARIRPISLRQFQKIVDERIRGIAHGASIYFVEACKARAAEQLYDQLSRRSDKELAKYGIRRREIPQFVRSRFYDEA